jgi:hypothetical protein
MTYYKGAFPCKEVEPQSNPTFKSSLTESDDQNFRNSAHIVRDLRVCILYITSRSFSETVKAAHDGWLFLFEILKVNVISLTQLRA